MFAHNADTVEGVAKHGRVDRKTDPLPKAKGKKKDAAVPESNAADTTTEAFEKIHARSVTLGSERYSVLAKLDLIEAQGELATPVDYKRGSPKKIGRWIIREPGSGTKVQLCVQALVLREMVINARKGCCFLGDSATCALPMMTGW